MFAITLTGSLISTPDISVDGRIPNADFPSLSSITGLLANAMGFDRTEYEKLNLLQSQMTIASRIERNGNEIADYQTAQLSADDTMWTSHHIPAERAGGASTYNSPAIMYKGYWADRVVTTVIQLPEEVEKRAIESLSRPARVLFIGRASCIPTRKIFLKKIDAVDVFEGILSLNKQFEHGDRVIAQWPKNLGGNEISSRILMVHDVKDWKTGRHLDSREVRQGYIYDGEKA